MQTASFCGGGRGASYRLPYLPSTRKILGRWVTFLGQAETAVRPGMRFRFGTMGFLASVMPFGARGVCSFPVTEEGPSLERVLTSPSEAFGLGPRWCSRGGWD